MVQKNPLKIIEIPVVLNAKTVIEVIGKFNTFLESPDTRVAINFSKMEKAEPGGLTTLLCYLRDLPRIKNNFRGLIIHSNDKDAEEQIARMGFYNMLGVSDDFEWYKEEIELYKELYCFNKTTPDEEVISVNEKIIYSFAKTSNNDNYKKAISWCILELVDNAKIHSHSDECVLSAQKRERGNNTESCIADRGHGIQKTMGDKDIASALQRCISPEKGVHSKGMGNGLYFTSELIKRDKSAANSSLTIWSGNAMLTVTSGNEPVTTKTDSYWQGTVVTLTLSNNIQSSIEIIKGSEVELTEELPNFYC